MAVARDPATYKPFLSGRYKVESGISKLGRDFGNGEVDSRVFQIDSEFERFRENLSGSRTDDFAKYYGVTDAFSSVAENVYSFVARRLSYEYPEYFTLQRDDRTVTFRCSLTGDTLEFDHEFQFIKSSDPNHVSGLDALASRIQEDLAVMITDASADKLVALHVTAPSYWDPSEKLGHDFPTVHAPVPHIDRVNAASRKQFGTFQNGGKYTRFAWGANAPDRLNRHPIKPRWFDGPQSDWDPPRFDPENPQLHISIERQTLVGLENCTLFTIHPYFIDASTLALAERVLLADAIESMTPESLEYKSLANDHEAIVHWLRS